MQKMCHVLFEWPLTCGKTIVIVSKFLADCVAPYGYEKKLFSCNALRNHFGPNLITVIKLLTEDTLDILFDCNIAKRSVSN